MKFIYHTAATYISQHFVMFICQLIPDYDTERGFQNATTKHDDRNVTSPLLNTFLSFYWRPMLSEDLYQTVEKLLADDGTTPDFVLIGKQVCYFLQMYCAYSFIFIISAAFYN